MWQRSSLRYLHLLCHSVCVGNVASGKTKRSMGVEEREVEEVEEGGEGGMEEVELKKDRGTKWR